MAQVCFSPDTVKPRNRELAILGMLSIISAPFVLYAHRLIALRLGITDDQYTTGLQGSTPADLNGEEKMAYCLGRVLADLKGPLGDEVWAEAIHEMGRKEALGVVHAVGSYVYICMLTNVNGRDDRFG
jgi:4-carboxymuconolactone decarboxylase